MSDRRIRVLISEDGEVKVEAFGFDGPECLKATEWLERGLMGVDVDRTLKHEDSRVTRTEKTTQEV